MHISGPIYITQSTSKKQTMGACFSSSNPSDGPRRQFDPHGRISTEIGTNRRQSTGTALTGLTHENERKQERYLIFNGLTDLLLQGPSHFKPDLMGHGTQQPPSSVQPLKSNDLSFGRRPPCTMAELKSGIF